MKQFSVLFLMIMGVLFLTSCSDNETDFQFQNEFEQSYKKWLAFKQRTENNYYYIARNVSWSGSVSETKIVVVKGKIFERTYNFYYYENEKLSTEKSYSWAEVGEELGTHKEGEALLTLDEIYQTARIQWLVNRKNAEYYFEAGNNGMISSCGYVEKGCEDDCFVGIRISKIADFAAKNSRGK